MMGHRGMIVAKLDCLVLELGVLIVLDRRFYVARNWIKHARWRGGTATAVGKVGISKQAGTIP